MKYKKLVILALIAAWSCTSNDPEPASDNQYLLTLTPVDEIGQWQAIYAADLLDFPEFKPLISSDVVVYKMEYQTSYNQTPIMASGLIAIPKNNDVPMAIASVHHGTIVAHADAPTEATGDYLLLSAMATTGMVTLIPDFLGFGSSTNVLHPYYVEEGEALPVVDMIHATRELMEDSTWMWNNNLFLTGYSEGGYVTMAAHKYIQEHPETGLTVTASASGSGAYDQVHMKNYFFNLETYNQPFYLPYAILAGQRYENTNEPLSLYFQSPYAELIPGLFDGANGSEHINGQLTSNVQDLLQLAFVEQSESGPDYQTFQDRLSANSLTDWTPLSPMKLFHGTADMIVPFDNSLATIEQLTENGGSENISFTAVEEGTHQTSFIPMFKEVVLWFSELDQ